MGNEDTLMTGSDMAAASNDISSGLDAAFGGESEPTTTPESTEQASTDNEPASQDSTATSTTTQDPLKDLDPELAGINEPRFKTEQGKNSWHNLRTLAQQRKEENINLAARVQKYEAELAKMRTNPATDQLPKNVESELNELRALRQQFFRERDPQFVEKYDK